MNRCVVRCPIKNLRTEKVVGYELLFQGGSENLYGENEATAADAVSSFLLNNSSVIFGDEKPVFITVTPSLLFRNLPKLFEKNRVIIQIEDNLVIHPLAMPIIKKYFSEGYQFAINDFQFSPKYFSMLDYATYVRVKVKGKWADSREKSSLENIVKMAQGFGKKCIATDVETKEEYEFAKQLNVDYMEGGYIAETLVAKADKIDYMQGSFFQLVVAVSKDEPDMAEIEEIVSRDAGLTYALLKLVNSAFFALRRRTASIRQALVTLGIGQLRQWVYMLGFQNEDPEGSEEMLKISFLRARFASELMDYIKNTALTKSDGYMMGMFSTLEYMVDAPIEEILKEIPISDEIKAALISQEGKAGEVLKLIVDYEKADWKSSKVMADKIGIEINKLGQLYMDCVEEVNKIWLSITTDFQRPGEAKVFRNENDGREHIEDVFK